MEFSEFEKWQDDMHRLWNGDENIVRCAICGDYAEKAESQHIEGEWWCGKCGTDELGFDPKAEIIKWKAYIKEQERKFKDRAELIPLFNEIMNLNKKPKP